MRLGLSVLLDVAKVQKLTELFLSVPVAQHFGFASAWEAYARLGDEEWNLYSARRVEPL